MDIIISGLHIAACLVLILLILLQQGKGADAGASFGGGDSSSLFGPTAENPLRNSTTIVAILFMATSLSLAYKARTGTIEDSGRLFLNSKIESDSGEKKTSSNEGSLTTQNLENPSSVSEPSLPVVGNLSKDTASESNNLSEIEISKDQE
ncbi:MAG TPA: preprotein translocase subunit SecG [Oligoflexia bacterium]|nr:preprotein translocase subunit SecG [Oligoflexia bacterium]HMP47906.1 preprotein translocase subunit SecG [Oligoflexia bacterium]